MLQRKDFTPYDQSCYKVVYYCNLAIQEARPDSKCYHEVLGFYILNSSTTKVSAVRDAQQSARRKPLQLRYCPSLVLNAKNTLQSMHGFSLFQLAKILHCLANSQINYEHSQQHNTAKSSATISTSPAKHEKHL